MSLRALAVFAAAATVAGFPLGTPANTKPLVPDHDIAHDVRASVTGVDEELRKVIELQHKEIEANMKASDTSDHQLREQLGRFKEMFTRYMSKTRGTGTGTGAMNEAMKLKKLQLHKDGAGESALDSFTAIRTKHNLATSDAGAAPSKYCPSVEPYSPISADCATSDLWYVGNGASGLVKCTVDPGADTGLLDKLKNEIEKFIKDHAPDMLDSTIDMILDSVVEILKKSLKIIEPSPITAFVWTAEIGRASCRERV